jgi:hypothetical protein
MELVRLPKGTIIKVNGLPCELAEDAHIKSAAVARMDLEAFLRRPEEGHGQPHDEWSEWLED